MNRRVFLSVGRTIYKPRYTEFNIQQNMKLNVLSKGGEFIKFPFYSAKRVMINAFTRDIWVNITTWASLFFVGNHSQFLLALFLVYSLFIYLINSLLILIEYWLIVEGVLYNN